MVLLVTGTSSFDAASWDDDNDGGDDDDDEVVGAVSSCAGLAASCRTWAAMSACLSLSNLKLPVLGTKTCSQKRLKGRGGNRWDQRWNKQAIDRAKQRA